VLSHVVFFLIIIIIICYFSTLPFVVNKDFQRQRSQGQTPSHNPWLVSAPGPCRLAVVSCVTSVTPAPSSHNAINLQSSVRQYSVAWRRSRRAGCESTRTDSATATPTAHCSGHIQCRCQTSVIHSLTPRKDGEGRFKLHYKLYFAMTAANNQTHTVKGK